VNVIAAHMGGQERPALLLTPLQECSQHDFTTAAIHAIRRLVHLPRFCRNSSRAGFEKRTSWEIVRSIN
jgi:hypothetical protein